LARHGYFARSIEHAAATKL
jgi:hypothetical protein